VAGAGLLLAAFTAQVHGSVRQKSPILHEPLYAHAGYQYLTRGAYRINFDSPPLLKQVAALPLLTLRLDPTLEPSADVSTRSRRFLYRNRVPMERIIGRARAPFLLFGILLGVVVFRWARELYGSAAGLLALWLYAFNPALIGQCGFANHDFGLACLSVASLYAGWRLARRPTLPRALGTGAVLGCALATKFSALLLLPALVGLGIGDALLCAGVGERLRVAGRRAALLAVVLAAAAVVVWADYGFLVGTIDVDAYRRALERLAPGGLAARVAAHLPSAVTLPASLYVEGAVLQTFHGWIGHINYLLGEVSSEGWWYYYLVTFLYRVPIPLFVLGLLRAATWEPAGRMRVWAEVWVLAYAVLTMVLFSTSRTQLGERYVLVVYPLTFVFLSGLAVPLWRPGEGSPPGGGDPPFAIGRTARWRRTLGASVALCLVWCGAVAWRTYPDHLTYFNLLAGGPDVGYRKIVEGVDLGQDAGGLERFVAVRGISEIKVSCFGCPPPVLQGPAFRPLPCGPTAGWVAVSVRHLVMPEPFLPRRCFSWLADREPVSRIGHSIHVFSIPEAPEEPTGSRAPGGRGAEGRHRSASRRRFS
jgi:4-amino-4-deoxy-L-arabinose transferase-like glycosyltransferase